MSAMKLTGLAKGPHGEQMLVELTDWQTPPDERDRNHLEAALWESFAAVFKVDPQRVEVHIENDLTITRGGDDADSSSDAV